MLGLLSRTIAKPIPTPFSVENGAQGQRLKREVPNEEYQSLAKKVDYVFVKPSDMLIEFKLFLEKSNWPIYNLDAVLPYMTRIAHRDNPKDDGWGWIPLRPSDHSHYANFAGSGKATVRGLTGKVLDRAFDWLNTEATRYTRPIPLHALKKIDALDNAGFTGNNRLFNVVVSDYTVEYDVVDPFLMVYYNKNAIGGADEGKIPHAHRFVIDFWDEPSFGLAEQLK